MAKKSALVSAAARGRLAKTPLGERIQDTLRQLEHELGGREALMGVLALNTRSQALTELMGLLADPLHDRDNLGVLCFQAGVTTGDLLSAYQSGLMHFAQTLAKREVAEHLPAVTRDVMVRAQPIEESCWPCRGTGIILIPATKTEPEVEEACNTCQGTGRVTRIPELDRQKAALDLGEMFPKKGGLSIGVQQINNQGQPAPTAGGTLEKLQQAVSAVLYTDDEVLEAEVLEPAPESPAADVPS
jgi:hypothetical protein